MSLPASLKQVISSGTLAPLNGLDCPLESTMLLPITSTGRIVMSRSERENKERDLNGQVISVEVKKEWALVGGKAESQKPEDAALLDFADGRFIKDGKQLPADECASVTFETPQTCLGREAIEELTGLKKDKNPDAFDKATKTFGWLIEKIHTSRDWVFLKSNRDVTLNKETGEKLKGFSTYTGVCRVTLSDQEIARLNSELKAFPASEHKEFHAFDWKVDEIPVENKKPYKCFVVQTGGDIPVRKYNKDIMFRFYWREFSELIVNGAKHN
jgi:hypothetical protein